MDLDVGMGSGCRNVVNIFLGSACRVGDIYGAFSEYPVVDIRLRSEGMWMGVCRNVVPLVQRSPF